MKVNIFSRYKKIIDPTTNLHEAVSLQIQLIDPKQYLSVRRNDNVVRSTVSWKNLAVFCSKNWKWSNRLNSARHSHIRAFSHFYCCIRCDVPRSISTRIWSQSSWSTSRFVAGKTFCRFRSRSFRNKRPFANTQYIMTSSHVSVLNEGKTLMISGFITRARTRIRICWNLDSFDLI